MKKRILGIITIAALLIAMIGATVNAASMTVAPSAKVGDTVTVTVNIGDVKNYEVTLNYDKDAYEFVSAKADGFVNQVNKKTAGRVVVVGAASDDAETAQNVTLTFKALKEVNNAKFEITHFLAGESDAIANTTVTSSVVKEEETPVTPDQPTTPDQPAKPADNNTTDAKNEAGKSATTDAKADAKSEGTKSEEAKSSSKKVLPQTGAPVYAYVLGAVAVAGVATLVAVKNNK